METNKRRSKFALGTAVIAVLWITALWSFPVGAAPNQQTGYDCSPTFQTSIPQLECDALVDLYTATAGTKWTDDLDWLVSSDPCSWNGVVCNAAGPPANVIEINLPNNNLDGTIPADLQNLTELIVLDLSDNLLTGPLPTEIGSIATLETLNISGNAGLTGPLPDSLTSLTALTTFDFSGTDLCEPQDSTFLAWKATVSTSYTSSGILCEIDCSSAETTVPQSECQALFALYNNTGGDTWAFHTYWLTNYDVCLWYGVNCSGGHVTEIILPNNDLAGTLPNQIGSFPFLTILQLSGNTISGGLPGQLQSLVNLVTMDLADNSMSGVLPNGLGNLTDLQTMDLANNSFNGQVPVSYANLTSLTYIDTTGSTLCLPDNALLQSWYNDPGLTHVDTIPNCIIPPTPTNTGVPITKTPTPIPTPTRTPTATNTATITLTPTMLGPFQTLTAMAWEDTLAATNNFLSRTPTSSPTSYYILVSQTLVPVAELTTTSTFTPEPTAVIVEGSGRGGFSAWWLIPILLALGLIGTGIFLMQRDGSLNFSGLLGKKKKDDDGFKTFQ